MEILNEEDDQDEDARTGGWLGTGWWRSEGAETAPFTPTPEGRALSPADASVETEEEEEEEEKEEEEDLALGRKVGLDPGSGLLGGAKEAVPSFGTDKGGTDENEDEADKGKGEDGDDAACFSAREKMK